MLQRVANVVVGVTVEMVYCPWLSVEDEVGSPVLDSLQPLASRYVTLCKQTVTIIEARRNESVHYAAQHVPRPLGKR